MAEEDASRNLPRQTPSAEERGASKANEAVAIRPKRGRLTLLSRRIYRPPPCHAQRQGGDEPVYRLALSELTGDAPINSNNTELLKPRLRHMQATPIEWSPSSSSPKRWAPPQLLGTATIEEQGRGR